jgi:hypothetical protein
MPFALRDSTAEVVMRNIAVAMVLAECRMAGLGSATEIGNQPLVERRIR